MTTLLALATYHGFDGTRVQTYSKRLTKRYNDRVRIGVKRNTARHSAWLAEMDRMARVKAEAAKLAREAKARAVSSTLRPIPNCLLRSMRAQNDIDAQAWSWMAFSKPYAGGR